MFKFFILSGVSIALWFMSFSAQASNGLYNCRTCTSDSSFLTVARAEAPLIVGTSYLYVSNTTTGVIKKFRVSYQEGNIAYGEPPIFRVNQITVDTTAYNSYQDALYYKNQVLSALSSNASVPGNLVESAWDLPGNSFAQDDVIDYFNDNIGLIDMIGGYFGALGAGFGILQNLSIEIVIDFEDGSSATFELTGIDVNNALTFKFKGGEDSLGNSIPANLEEMAGDFKFSASVFESYSGLASRYGTFVYGGAGEPLTIPTGTVTVYDCYMDPSTKTLTCNQRNTP